MNNILLLSKNYEEIHNFLNNIFEQFKIGKESNILIKPNIVSREPYPTTTDPLMLSWVLEAIQERTVENVLLTDGPSPDKVYISKRQFGSEDRSHVDNFLREFETIYYHMSDFPKNVNERILGHTRSTIMISPLARVCRQYGIQTTSVYDHFRFVERHFCNVTFRVPDLRQFDLMLSLPVLKLHALCGYSGANKNLYGLLHHFDKVKLHVETKTNKLNFMQFIEKLPTFIMIPTVHILDATRIPNIQEKVWAEEPMKEHSLDNIIAGVDAVKIDEKVEELFCSKRIKRAYTYSDQKTVF